MVQHIVDALEIENVGFLKQLFGLLNNMVQRSEMTSSWFLDAFNKANGWTAISDVMDTEVTDIANMATVFYHRYSHDDDIGDVDDIEDAEMP